MQKRTEIKKSYVPKKFAVLFEKRECLEKILKTALTLESQ